MTSSRSLRTPIRPVSGGENASWLVVALLSPLVLGSSRDDEAVPKVLVTPDSEEDGLGPLEDSPSWGSGLSPWLMI